jgi:hypothetical protein
MPTYYIAKFRGAKGRYLVEREGAGYYGGQRIRDRRQEKYGNPPDAATGLYLDESYRSFSGHDLVTLKPFKPSK